MQPRANSATVAARLRRYRRFILPGLLIAALAATATVYKIRLIPPTFERDSAVYATSSTQVLVDFPYESELVEPDRSVAQLAERAGIYARLAASPGVVSLIGRETHLPAGAIDARGPFNPRAERLLREPAPERRSSQLIRERDAYHVRFDAEEDSGVPIVEIFAQAPTVAKANRLADGSARALAAFVKGFEQKTHPGLSKFDKSRRVSLTLHQLGRAQGGIVNPNADMQIAILAFFAALAGYWLIVLGGFSLASFLRGRQGVPQKPGHDPARRPLGVARARRGVTEHRR